MALARRLMMLRKIYWFGIFSTALIAALAFAAGAGAAAPPADFLQATATPEAMGTPGAGGMLASPGAAVQVAQNATLGNILTDSAGMTLYVFKNDTPGTSACTGTCAQNWPALTIPAGAMPIAGTGITGQLGVIQRPDGTDQVTYNDMPLYRFHGDMKPGDANGQGLLNGAWSVALVTAAAPAAPAAATPQAPASY
jgi:predicted lipoprotein with Yx(FWY)xxD motif